MCCWVTHILFRRYSFNHHHALGFINILTFIMIRSFRAIMEEFDCSKRHAKPSQTYATRLGWWYICNEASLCLTIRTFLAWYVRTSARYDMIREEYPLFSNVLCIFQFVWEIFKWHYPIIRFSVMHFFLASLYEEQAHSLQCIVLYCIVSYWLYCIVLFHVVLIVSSRWAYPDRQP